MTCKVTYEDIINLLWKRRDGPEFQKLLEDLGENSYKQDPVEGHPDSFDDGFSSCGLGLFTFDALIQIAWIWVEGREPDKRISVLPAGILETDNIEDVRNKFRNPPVASKLGDKPSERFRLSDSYIAEESMLHNISIEITYTSASGNPKLITLMRTDKENWPLNKQDYRYGGDTVPQTRKQ